MIKETFVHSTDSDYASHFAYETTGPSTIASLHVDAFGGVWLEANDGQKVLVPSVVRKLISKRLREGAYA